MSWTRFGCRWPRRGGIDGRSLQDAQAPAPSRRTRLRRRHPSAERETPQLKTCLVLDSAARVWRPTAEDEELQDGTIFDPPISVMSCLVLSASDVPFIAGKRPKPLLPKDQPADCWLTAGSNRIHPTDRPGTFASRSLGSASSPPRRPNMAAKL
jgi:hypothetical protein